MTRCHRTTKRRTKPTRRSGFCEPGPDSQSPARQPGREGSVIVVVLVMTIGLLILGVLLYTDSSIEATNAEYFAKSAKLSQPTVSPQQINNDALRQIILGANLEEHHSPFYGGRNSLLPGMFGSDRVPYNGPGVHINDDGTLIVDQNYDGTADGSNVWMELNQSVAATGEDRTDPAQVGGPRRLMNFPRPDAGYTYPDNNSPYLFYRAMVRDGAGNNRLVMIPSYLRPQLLRRIQPNPALWYSDPATAAFCLRPHTQHVAVLDNGQPATSGGNPIRRFVSSAAEATSLGLLAPFPFTPPQVGVWDGFNGPSSNYDFDADLDGDGVKESIYMDMDLGVFDTPDGTRKFVPIVAAKLVPLDDRFDLNAHGNVAKITRDDRSAFPEPGTMTSEMFHSSNQAAGRSEVNPHYATRLSNVPGAGAPETDQHRRYYGRNPANRTDLSNMEQWWLLTGRPVIDSSDNITGLIAGRWGEEQRMEQAFNTSGGTRFPLAGETTSDDNNNSLLGGAFSGLNRVFPPQVQFPAFVHPNDYRGRGRWWNAGTPTKRNLRTIGRHPFPRYDDYDINPPQWPSANPELVAGRAMPLFDEPGEMILDPELRSLVTNDRPYNAGDSITLHMADSQLATTGRDSDRVLRLAPVNFQSDTNAETIRKLFTSLTQDVKNYGKTARPGYREWEFTNVGGGVFVFPPTFPNVDPNSQDPLRGVVRELLNLRDGDGNTKPLQRMLSTNKFLDRFPPPQPGQLGTLRFRPLTPHVTEIDNNTGQPLLGREPVSGPNSVVANRFSITRPEQIGTDPDTRYRRQEWLARYDRQRMCRDIYMLLYLLGGSNDGLPYNSTDNSSFQVYTPAQLEEMARLAVNLVDQVDPDDISTLFEYDINPVNGWDLDDDPFTDRRGGQPERDRAIVFGVERQQLTFSEALTFLAKRTKDQTTMMPVDHEATAYDDTRHHLFSYIELQNVTPAPVSFGLPGGQNSGIWQLVVKDGGSTNDDGIAVSERRLTFLAPAGGVSAPMNGSNQLSRYTVGTQSDKDYTDNNGNIRRSHFRANPNYDDPNTNPIRLVPRVGLSLDLMQPPLNRYRINKAPTSSSLSGEGDTITPTTDPNNPPGKELLQLEANNVPIDPNSPMSGSLDGLNSGEVIVRLQLRRRLHPHRQTPVLPSSNPIEHHRQTDDNPWIVVDEFTVPLRVFDLINQDTKDQQLRDELNKVRSSERYQPLDGVNSRLFPQVPDTATSPPEPKIYRLNSFQTVNRATTEVLGRDFTLYQPQFDRAFSSAGELLSLPLYGGSDERATLGEAPRYRTNVTTALGTGAIANNKIDWNKTAAARFLDPNKLPGPTNPGNRWYRLFSVLGIPDDNPDPRLQPWFVDVLGRNGSPPFPTKQGYLNVNTLFHPAHLAGILDAPELLNATFNADGAGALNDRQVARDWWRQFLRARDGDDPATGLPLPGVPGVSKPFRDVGDQPHPDVTAPGDQVLEHTLLRTNPGDDPLTGPRLLEVVSSNPQNIDVTTRYRLLSKAMNHTTTRGNAYLLILRIEFFEAVEVTPDNPSFPGETVVRIGGKLPGNQSPDITTYYVIDRSRAFNLLRGRDLPAVSGGRFTWSFDQQMDFRPLILSRQRVD